VNIRDFNRKLPYQNKTRAPAATFYGILTAACERHRTLYTAYEAADTKRFEDRAPEALSPSKRAKHKSKDLLTMPGPRTASYAVLYGANHLEDFLNLTLTLCG
jgi:hypothetical protein